MAREKKDKKERKDKEVEGKVETTTTSSLNNAIGESPTDSDSGDPDTDDAITDSEVESLGMPVTTNEGDVVLKPVSAQPQVSDLSKMPEYLRKKPKRLPTDLKQIDTSSLQNKVETGQSDDRNMLTDRKNMFMDKIDASSLPSLQNRVASISESEGMPKTLDAGRYNSTVKSDGTRDYDSNGNVKPLTWDEYIKSQQKVISDSEKEASDLQDEQDSRNKYGKWAKVAASIGDATSAIANLAGTANWGRSAEQSSMAEGINKEMKEAREKYTRDIKSIRDRIDKARNSVMTAQHYNESEAAARRRMNLQDRREDRMAAKDLLWAQFKANEQELKARNLDITEQKVQAYIDSNSRRLDLVAEKYGWDYALGLARLEIMGDTNDIRREHYNASDAGKAVKDADKARVTAIASKWSTVSSELKSRILNGRNIKEISDDERILLNEIANANTDNKIRSVIKKLDANSELKSYLDSVGGSSSSSASASAPADNGNGGKASFSL